MPWQDNVCLSVCLSHAGNGGIVSKRLHISSKFVLSSGSPTILVYPHQPGWQYSDGNPLNRGRQIQGGYEKITIFAQSRFISEMMQAIVTIEGE